MNGSNGSKNVKLPVELEEAVKKRAPDRPPGETLLEIYKEYEYLETVARRVTGRGETEKINISEAINKFFDDTCGRLDKLQKSNDELKTMLQGLQLFFTKVRKE